MSAIATTTIVTSMSDPVREAFLYYIPQDQLEERGGDEALLPLESVPAALERLLLDGDDDMALSVLHEAAEPLGRSSGVPYEPWKEVVEVLLDQRAAEDEEIERGSKRRADEQEADDQPPEESSRRRRQPPRAAARAAQPQWVNTEDHESDLAEDEYQESNQRRRRRGLSKSESDEEAEEMDEEEYDEDDDDDDDDDDEEEGGFLPVPNKRKRAGAPVQRSRITDAHRERAEHVFGLFLDQLTEKKARLQAHDLVIIAKKMGDKLSLAEAEDMVQQAVRLGAEQAPNSQQTSGVSPFELAAVIRRLGMRRS